MYTSQPLKKERQYFVKKANYQLSIDPSMWVDEIFQYIVRQYPFLAEYLPGDIDWQHGKVDIPKGVAVGEILLRSGENIVTIPVVVKETELSPIDVFQHRDQYYLLNERNVMRFLYNTSVGTPSVTNRYFRGYNSYPAQGELQSHELFNKLSQYAGYEKGLARLVSQAREFGYKEPAQILKALKIPAKSTAKQELRDQEEKLASVSYSHRLPGTYDFVRKYFKNGVKIAQEKIDILKTPNAKLGFQKEAAFFIESGVFIKESIQLPERPGMVADKSYIVFDGSFTPHHGKCYTRKRLKGGEPENIFISNSGKFNINPLNWEPAGENYQPMEINGKDRIPDDKNSKNVAIKFVGEDGLYGPYLLESDRVTPDGTRTLIVVDPETGKMALSVSDKFSSPVKVEAADSVLTNENIAAVYVVPEIDTFVSLKERFSELPQPKLDDYIKNTAVEKAASVSTVRQTTQPGLVFEDGLYRLEVNNTKLAEVGRDEMRAILLSMGSGSNVADYALKQAESDTVTILNLRTTQKTASVKPSRAVLKKACKAIQELSPAILKMAFVANESEVMDVDPALLGLSMADEENVEDYVSAIDVFSRTSSLLAKCLYDVRTGALPAEVSEVVVKSALVNLDKVILALSDLKPQ